MSSIAQKQETYLRKSRRHSIDPSIHPHWSITHWLYYVLTFPIEYALIFCFVVPSCIVSSSCAFYNLIKTRFTKNHALIDRNNLKDNLKQSPIFNGHTLHKNTENEIVSVIIPCYNESKSIQSTLIYLDRNCSNHHQIEIILVDGNSPDIDALETVVKETETYLNIKSEHIQIISKGHVSGRGTCQNIGALFANGKYLFFIHADTIPPHNYDRIIRNSFDHNNKRNVLLGAFTFAIDRSLMEYPLAGVAWVEFFARFRNKIASLPYGDQGLWIKRERFIQIGGFKWIPMLDDVEFVLRCRQIAATQHQVIYVDRRLAYCSPRRWIENGVAKTTVWNQWIWFLYVQIKLTPHRIYEIYYGRNL